MAYWWCRFDFQKLIGKKNGLRALSFFFNTLPPLVVIEGITKTWIPVLWHFYIPNQWCGRNHNDECGVIGALGRNCCADRSPGARQQQLRLSEGRLQLWCYNWNFTKDLFETKTRCCLSEADRLLSFSHSVIGLFLSGCFTAADVLSVEIILQGAGAYPYKICPAKAAANNVSISSAGVLLLCIWNTCCSYTLALDVLILSA